jgi:aminoglycoside phosphotransferase (APT) family kinase protein
VEASIAAYLAPRLGATGEVKITHLLRIPGGASRETWMFKAAWDDADGRHAQEFILRKDPPASLLDTDRKAEFTFYDSFRGSDVPVPRMRYLEQDASVLGGPFFIMDRITSGQAIQGRIVEDSYQAIAGTIAENVYGTLANIATFDWTATGIAQVAPVPTVDTAWEMQLSHWERVIDEAEISPQPITRAAIRWLLAKPPPPAQRISVVHGDYRIGNLMMTPAGEITGVLDWEMAHLGDPLEDLAWSFNKCWHWAHDGRPGGIATPEQAIEVWERRSGLRANLDAVHWWWLFNDVKCQGIWLTGARAVQDGNTRDPFLAMIAHTHINRQDRFMLERMGRMSS